jgi:adenylylsulfate kinase
MNNKSENVVWHAQSVSKQQREEIKKHRSAVLWYTGLSGSGKSTIANEVDVLLNQLGVHTYVLDGDNIRHGLNGDLGFSDKDRVENIRRIGEVAKLFAESGLVISTAFISPFRDDRAMVRKLVGDEAFIEVFIDTPIDVCEQRDPKGLYKKARAGEIKHFTGIDSEYQAPIDADIHVDTSNKGVKACAEQIVAVLKSKGLLGELG